MKNLFVLLILLLTLSGCITIKQKSTNLDKGLGILSLYAFNGDGTDIFGLVNLGHAFVTFVNTSEEDLVIGKYTVKPNEEVTIGTWGINEYFGVWYNVESVYINIYDKYPSVVSISASVFDKSDIDKMTNYIIDNDTWGLLDNCSNFALGLWNEVFPNYGIALNSFSTPDGLFNAITMFDNYQVARGVIMNTNVCYYDNELIYFEVEDEKN